MQRARSLGALALACAALAAAPSAQAQLFADDEARRAILELRQRLEAQRIAADRQGEDLRRGQEESLQQLRRSLLELQTQIESVRGEIARMRGQDEQVTRDLSQVTREVAEIQRRQKDLAQGVEDRLRKMEPVKVTVDGREFAADPAEQREFDAALAVFRRGDFPAAQSAFTTFMQRFPQSGYRTTALFWLGNAQYANRDYRGAITNFRALLAQGPEHPRAPEAVLSIANCQIELKDMPGARRTLEDLIKAYPQSEAAVAARERLARLR
jgi:tol-pal system protein YbgF